MTQWTEHVVMVLSGMRNTYKL